MTRNILTLIVAFAMTLGINAQNNRKTTCPQPEQRAERLNRIANHVADELKLDDKTQAWFVPLYVAYQDTLCGIRRAYRPCGTKGECKQNRQLTDSEARQMVEKRFDRAERELAIKREYYAKFQGKLTPQQIATIFCKRMQHPQRRHHMKNGGKHHRMNCTANGQGRACKR